MDEEQQQHLTGHFDHKTQICGGMLSLVTSNPDTKKITFGESTGFSERTTSYSLFRSSSLYPPAPCREYPRSTPPLPPPFFLRRDQRLAHEGWRKTQTPPFSSSALAHLRPWSVRPSVRRGSVRRCTSTGSEEEKGPYVSAYARRRGRENRLRIAVCKPTE